MYAKFHNHLKVCLTNDQQFMKFKGDPDLEYMTEHQCLDAYKYQFLGEIESFSAVLNLNVNDVITSCMLNDKYGSPFLSELCYNNKIYFISPNTLRYIVTGLHILFRFGKPDVSILELGGGYGGQILILHILAKMVGINISNYTVIDFPEVLEFIKFYLSKFNISVVTHPFVDGTIADLNREYDIFVSNYCLGELDFHLQKYYIDKIFPCVTDYYLIYNNFLRNGEIHPSLMDKNPLILPEIPLTGELNKLIVSR